MHVIYNMSLLVEPMGKECEQLQIQALTEYLGVTVRIEYLDGK